MGSYCSSIVLIKKSDGNGVFCGVRLDIVW